MPPLRRIAAVPRNLHAVLWTGGRGPILAIVAFGWLLSLGMRLVFPALLPSIRMAFDIDLTTAGLLISGLWFAYAVGQFPGGVLGDRIGPRNVLVASTGVGTATLGMLVAAADFTAFFAATVLFGLATGLYATTRFTLIAAVYPDHDGAALGIASAAGNVGTTVLPVIAGLLAGYVGWRVGFGFALPLFVATAAGLWLVVPSRVTTGTTPPSPRQVVRVVARRPVLLAGSTMLLLSVVYQAFTGFFPTYLVDVKGIGAPTAAALFGLFFAGGIAAQPLVGAAGDRFGTRRVMAASGATAAAALVALPFVAGLPALVALTLLASVHLGFWPAAQSYVIEALPAGVEGSGFGLLRSAYLLAASVGPAAVGAMADAGAFDEAFLLLAGIALLASAVSAVLP